MPAYSIGIDLGTSNCALSYIDLENSPGRPSILPIRQLENTGSVSEQSILPSFLYFPTVEETNALPEGGSFSLHGKPKVVGQFARRQSATLPGRVVHSAKSWLCHGGIDREGPILPWQSEEIPSKDRLSPVTASAYYLGLLRAVWNEKFPAAPFNEQDVVITVPASFDEAAQRLTLEAAASAGFPRNVRLLEEPQSAFYHWLNQHGQGRDLVSILPELREREQLILICDIGGGTSDFSLFEVAPVASEDRVPAIRRVEVSDHLLLGGDNIDLALAHALEKQLTASGKKLSAGQWAYLLVEARQLKERSLAAGTGKTDETFSVSIPGTGSSLFASTRTATITRAEIESIILDGFFPACAADDLPTRAGSGLKELGLPYAADPAVTHHIAGFLRGRKIDALLLTGGTFQPEVLRERISTTLSTWQPGHRLATLVNDELDLAVARGAACYGEILHQPFGRITGGYPHSLYLEIQTKGKQTAPRLVCILPKGFEEHQVVQIDQLNLELVVGKPVRFQPYFSTFRENDRAGDLVDLDRDLFRSLPSLQTGIDLQEGLTKPATGRLPVTLEISLNELGLLQITAVHTTANAQSFRWELDFNLRKGGAEEEKETDGEVPTPVGPGVSKEKIAAAADLISTVYGKGKITEQKPRRLVRDTEEILGQKRQEWNLALLRALWPPLQQGMTLKSRSPEHEASWLNFAGYIMRPGYGAALDPFRIDELWRLTALGISFPKEKRVLNQWWILWRRVAGGLDHPRQEALLAPLLSQFQNRSADGAELFRFVGSLERISQTTKEQLANQLTKMIETRRPQALTDAIWALGRILNRAPLYAGPDSVVPPGEVKTAFARLQKLDWTDGPFSGLNETFARASRLTGLRHQDLDDEFRETVLTKMTTSGATEKQLQVVREYVPLELADQASLFGESFPAGLILF